MRALSQAATTGHLLSDKTNDLLTKNPPNILVLPLNLGPIGKEQLEMHEQQIKSGMFDYVILGIPMSGAIFTREPYSIVPFLERCAVPVFCIPIKDQAPEYTLRYQILYKLETETHSNVVVLDKAYFLILSQIIEELKELHESDPATVISALRAKYSFPTGKRAKTPTPQRDLREADDGKGTVQSRKSRSMPLPAITVLPVVPMNEGDLVFGKIFWSNLGFHLGPTGHLEDWALAEVVQKIPLILKISEEGDLAQINPLDSFCPFRIHTDYTHMFLRGETDFIDKIHERGQTVLSGLKRFGINDGKLHTISLETPGAEITHISPPEDLDRAVKDFLKWHAQNISKITDKRQLFALARPESFDWTAIVDSKIRSIADFPYSSLLAYAKATKERCYFEEEDAVTLTNSLCALAATVLNTSGPCLLLLDRDDTIDGRYSHSDVEEKRYALWRETGGRMVPTKIWRPGLLLLMEELKERKPDLVIGMLSVRHPSILFEAYTKERAELLQNLFDPNHIYNAHQFRDEENETRITKRARKIAALLKDPGSPHYVGEECEVQLNNVRANDLGKALSIQLIEKMYPDMRVIAYDDQYALPCFAPGRVVLASNLFHHLTSKNLPPHIFRLIGAL
jgi:hypothetical protein